MKRREFVLKTAKGLPLIIAAPTLLASCSEDEGTVDDNNTNPGTNEQDFDVIVIGAGVAGLAAARSLKESGLSVKVFESQEKVGGRVRTNRSIGIPFDEGASWIHGPDGGNPITALAQEAGATTYRTANRTEHLHAGDGTRYSESEIATFFGVYQQRLAEIQGAASLQDSVEDVFTRLYPGEIEDPIWKYALSALLEFDTGSDISRLSASAFGDADVYPGDDVLFPGGYDVIPNYLAQGLDIDLETVVSAIDYTGSLVQVTAGGTNYAAQYAIVTVPLGVLKNNVISFTPALPSLKQEAIDGIEMGTLNKFLFQWDTTFWANDAQHIGCTVDQKGRFNYFLNANTFAPNANALMGFAFGNYGLETESMSDSQVIDAAMDTLKRIYGNSIPQPTNMLRTRWANNPHSYGCYSFFTKGYPSEALDVIGEQVDNKLFFAGEHTLSVYNATVHGAYLTGLREAEKILRLVNG